MTPESLAQRVASQDNDWTKYEPLWHTLSSDPLIGEPAQAPKYRCEPKLSVSVVVPAWNAAATIGPCLQAFASSTLNVRYGSKLEVIVVDDGSTDETWQAIQRADVDLEVRAIRTEHSGQSHALNIAAAAADGEVVICCDADMILNIFALEALARRHELGGVVTIGFRSEIPAHHPIVTDTIGSGSRWLFRSALAHDNRVRFDRTGWPENMLFDSHMLRGIGYGRRLVTPDWRIWDLPRMVYGCLFGIGRTRLVSIGGFDPRLSGWGFSDSYVGARAVGAGDMVIPVLTASGYHVAHGIRTPRQWAEGRRNWTTYGTLMSRPIDGAPPPGPQPRIVRSAHRRRGGWSPATTLSGTNAIPPMERAALEAAAGRHDSAASLLEPLATDVPTLASRLWARALRMSGNLDRLTQVFDGHADPDIVTEVGLAYAAACEYETAQQYLLRAVGDAYPSRLARYVLCRPRRLHLERAEHYIDQGLYHVALRDLDAALVQDPGAPDVRLRRHAAASVTLAPPSRGSLHGTPVACRRIRGKP